jgi:YHS domain-containing protein
MARLARAYGHQIMLFAATSSTTRRHGGGAAALIASGPISRSARTLGTNRWHALEEIYGLAQFSTTYNGVTYRFSSAESRDRFIATPEKFVPQYGGYCALAISLNKIADIEPDQWAIVNDKLYLNNGFIAQSLWSLDKSGNIVRGDQNWPLIPKRGNP